MKIKENHYLTIEKYPYAESLKEKFLIDVVDVVDSGYENRNYTNIRGEKLDAERSSSAPIIREWVHNIIRNKYVAGGGSREAVTYETGIWFAKYDVGDSCICHNHLPYALFSFVYFVNCPKGSSPLIFTTSGKKIKAEEGKVVIFPSSLMHHVPKNRCKNRITLAGNTMLYRLNKL